MPAPAEDGDPPGPKAGKAFRPAGKSTSEDLLRRDCPRRIPTPDAGDEGLFESDRMGGEVRVRAPGEAGTVGEPAPVTGDGPAIGTGLHQVLSTPRGRPARREVRVRRAALFGRDFRASGLAIASVDRDTGHTFPPEAGDGHPSTATGDASANEESSR